MGYMSSDILPEGMATNLSRAVDSLKSSSSVLAISHIDADGITALAIIVAMLQRLGKKHEWRNIHQLNSETILEVKELVEQHNPDLVIFSDLGTGQKYLINEHIIGMEGVNNIIILDHHLPQDDDSDEAEDDQSNSLIEINPSQHGLSGSYDLSGAGAAFLLAYAASPDNVDLTELAIVGASGDLQDYYGKGFSGINKTIIELGVDAGFLSVDRDLTFFGINTRPLPYLLQYSTEPYLPGVTGDGEAAFALLNSLGIEVKSRDDNWRMWVDLESSEKQLIIQSLFSIILEYYSDPQLAKGILGDVISLVKRPHRSELRSAKEFSTLLNACGRNRRADVGVKVCLGDPDAYVEGKALLQQHRANLAMALRRLEDGGYEETEGMYVVNDPQTPDTIIGIVIGMAQGSRIVPENKPVIGVCTNTINEGPMLKISGRCRRHLVDRGVNLKESFVRVGDALNQKHDMLVVEAGGHPMAAGAFVHTEVLDEFLSGVSSDLVRIIQVEKE
jgi:RecJ-like exonuclease